MKDDVSDCSYESAGRDNKQGGTINEIIVIYSKTCVYKRLRGFTFLQVGSPFFNVASRHDQDKIFRINTSFLDTTFNILSSLNFFFIFVINKTNACLCNIPSLKKQPKKSNMKKNFFQFLQSY